VTAPPDPFIAAVDGAAFRRLLHTAQPASFAQVADDLHHPEPVVQAAIDDLRKQGQMRLDEHGRIIGSAGLSVEPDRHEINLEGRQFWTWCAYDFFGIFAALGANGHARSITPDTGQSVRIDFRDGQPQPAPLVLFLPADDPACSANAYDQWCPHSNLFHTAEAARAWANEHDITGQVLTLAQASVRGGAAWKPLTRSLTA
jgi:alkylmercury lyase